MIAGGLMFSGIFEYLGDNIDLYIVAGGFIAIIFISFLLFLFMAFMNQGNTALLDNNNNQKKKKSKNKDVA